MLKLLFRSGRIACVLLAGVLVYPDVAFAQNPTLAEIAHKEQERRKATKNSDKVLTNKDLPPSAAKPAPATPDGTTAQPAADAAAQKPEAKPAGEPDKDEAWWKQRMTQARETLRRNEMFVEALQTPHQLADRRLRRPRRSLPAREDRRRSAEGARRDGPRCKADIELGKKQIADIEEEARRAGVPPGWLR